MDFREANLIVIMEVLLHNANHLANIIRDLVKHLLAIRCRLVYREQQVIQDIKANKAIKVI